MSSYYDYQAIDKESETLATVGFVKWKVGQGGGGPGGPEVDPIYTAEKGTYATKSTVADLQAIVDTLAASGVYVRSPVETMSALPEEAENGDLREATDTGIFYLYVGINADTSGWLPTAGLTSLEDYYTKAQVDALNAQIKAMISLQQTDIDNLDASLVAETTERTNRTIELQQAIDDEVGNRITGDTDTLNAAKAYTDEQSGGGVGANPVFPDFENILMVESGTPSFPMTAEDSSVAGLDYEFVTEQDCWIVYIIDYTNTTWASITDDCRFRSYVVINGVEVIKDVYGYFLNEKMAGVRSTSPILVKKGSTVQFKTSKEKNIAYSPRMWGVYAFGLQNETEELKHDPYSPDYANIDPTNHITSLDQTWTVDKDGWVLCGMRPNSGIGNFAVIPTYMVNGVGTSYITTYPNSTTALLPVSVGDVVSMSCGRTDGLGTWDAQSCSCLFIPPKLIVSPMATQIDYRPDYTNVETINRTPNNWDEWTVDRDGWIVTRVIGVRSSALAIMINYTSVYQSAVVAGDGSEISYYGVYRVSVGDVVQVSGSPDVRNCGTYFIPPKYSVPLTDLGVSRAEFNDLSTSFDNHRNTDAFRWQDVYDREHRLYVELANARGMLVSAPTVVPAPTDPMTVNDGLGGILGISFQNTPTSFATVTVNGEEVYNSDGYAHIAATVYIPVSNGDVITSTNTQTYSYEVYSVDPKGAYQDRKDLHASVATLTGQILTLNARMDGKVLDIANKQDIEAASQGAGFTVPAGTDGLGGQISGDGLDFLLGSSGKVTINGETVYDHTGLLGLAAGVDAMQPVDVVTGDVVVSSGMSDLYYTPYKPGTA